MGIDFARVSKEGVEGGMIGHEEEVIMSNRGSHRFDSVGVGGDRFQLEGGIVMMYLPHLKPLLFHLAH